MPGVSILNFHYVRPLHQTRFPRIKACDVHDFRENMKALRQRSVVVSAREIADAIDEGDELPDGAVALTFDDGLSDHYSYVLPILVDMEMTAAFFPPAEPIEKQRVLDVHKVHFILASVDSALEIAARVDDHIVRRGLGNPSTFHALYSRPSDRDPAETIYVKRMLQKGLPADERSLLAGRLFREFVTADEQAFAEELYLTVDQLRVMSGVGMTIGSHSYSHPWLSTLDESAQALEVDESLRFLDRVDETLRSRWVMCYPYGDFDARTVEVVRSRGCCLGLADRHGVYDLDPTTRFAVPRVTQNDYDFNAEG